MGVFVGVGSTLANSRAYLTAIAGCGLLLMSACSSKNPDALTNPNTQTSSDLNLDDAMNAVAAAPANTVDTTASTATASQLDATAGHTTSQKVPATRVSPRARAESEMGNATVVPDEEEPSDADPAEPTNSLQADEPQSNRV